MHGRARDASGARERRKSWSVRRQQRQRNERAILSRADQVMYVEHVPRLGKPFIPWLTSNSSSTANR